MEDENASIKSIYNFSYNYALNSPLTYYDPNGLYPKDACGVVDECKKWCKNTKKNGRSIVFCLLCYASDKKPPPPRLPTPTIPKPSEPKK